MNDLTKKMDISKKRLIGVSLFALVVGAYLTSAINYTVPRIFSNAQNISTEAATEKVSNLTYLNLLTFIVSALLAAFIGGLLSRKRGWLVGLIANSIYIIVFSYLLTVVISSGSDTMLGGISAQLYIFIALALLIVSSIFGGIWGQKSYDEQFDLDKDNKAVTIFGVRWGNYFWILPFIVYPFLSSLVYIIYSAVVAYLADFYLVIHPSLWLSIAWWFYFAIVPVVVYFAATVFYEGLLRFFRVMQYGQTEYKNWGRTWRVLFYGIGAPILSWGLAAIATSITHHMPKPISGDWKIGLILISIFPAIGAIVALASWIKGRMHKKVVEAPTVLQETIEVPSTKIERKANGPEGKSLGKILHFEDDTFLAGMYNTKFPMKGFEHVTYNSPSEDPVLVVLKENPDLIIMDILMPVMDGYTATRLLKADKRTAHIPILGLCNMGQKADIQKALDLGMSDYLVTAAHMPDEVVQRVKEILNLK